MDQRVLSRGVLTIDTNEPAPAAEDGSDARKSVTVPLPSTQGLLRGIVALVFLALIATVTLEAIHIHHLSRARSEASLALLRAQAGGGSGDTSVDVARTTALSAATSYATAFATYNYHHLSRDFAVTEAHAAEPFLAQYRKETAGIQSDLVKLKSISAGKVLSAGVVSVTPSTAVVDLFLDQTIVNSAHSKPSIEPQRMQMSLERSSATGQWEITKVTLS